MNAAQHSHAREIIENARLLCNTHLVTMNAAAVAADPRGYVCCALGEMALAAGHTVGDLMVVVDQPVARYTESLPLLASAYGLDERQCDRITRANDAPLMMLGEVDAGDFLLDPWGSDGPVYDMQRARKAAVLRTLDSFVAVAA